MIRNILILLLIPTFAAAQDTTLKTFYFNKLYEDPRVDSMPRFPGGMEAMHTFLELEVRPSRFLHSNIRGVEQRMVVTFHVTAAGKVVEPRVEMSTYMQLEEEILGAFKRMPDWVPAIKDSVDIGLQVALPLNYVVADGMFYLVNTGEVITAGRTHNTRLLKWVLGIGVTIPMVILVFPRLFGG